MNAELVTLPGTGEVIELGSADTDALLDARDQIVDLTRNWHSVRRTVDDELIRRMDFEGRRSIGFRDYRVDVNAPTEKRWDITALRDTLDALADDGVISLVKASNCIRVSYEPVWREIKTLLSDPRTREQIESCFVEVDARRQLKVVRRG